ncbi:MAG: hypothetical protein RLO52_02315 [Sandaracinaceae bacterium]
MEDTSFADLVSALDESLTLPIPHRFEKESRLPGAKAAWRRGLHMEREALLTLVLTPMPEHDTQRLVAAAVELALLDSSRFSKRVDGGALGARLIDLARAEVASRAASCLAAALNPRDDDADSPFERSSAIHLSPVLESAGKRWP